MSDIVERLRRPVFDSEEWYSALGAAFKMRDAGHRDSCARDLMDSYVDEAATERTEAADEIERLRAEVERLMRILGDPGTTHAEGCSTWGPKHWQCALNERDALLARVEAAERRYQWLRDWMVDTRLLTFMRCQIDEPETLGDWWVFRPPYGIDGTAWLGYGNNEDAAIDAAMEGGK